MAVGTPLDVALEEAADRTGMPEYRFFVTAVVLQRETGGSLAETLDNLVRGDPDPQGHHSEGQGPFGRGAHVGLRAGSLAVLRGGRPVRS